MVHGLAVRRGEVTILCNGRRSVHGPGLSFNTYKGEAIDLLDAINTTLEHPSRRFLIPQDKLHQDVECDKCRSLMDPIKRRRYMKKIYANSWRWKARRANRKKQNHNVLIPLGHKTKDNGECVHKNTHQTIEIPSNKTCVLTISFV